MTSSPQLLVARTARSRLRRLLSYSLAALLGTIFLKLYRLRQRLKSELEVASPDRSPSPSNVLVASASVESRAREPQVVQFGLADDQFELISKLDSGGQGTVYLCRRVNTGHEYAAKVISTSPLEKSERQLASLRREIRIMRELHHPYIVNLHEAFWTDDQCLIVMDLARGGNLFDLLDSDIRNCPSEPFTGLGGTEFASKYVAGQLLEGIGYMHSHHVLHRDLKLENILIKDSSHSEEEGCPLHNIKIADFGLSKSQVRRASSKQVERMQLERTMTAVGTPDYVAPEVLDGTYDERVDFWSFGVILYAILCGRMPFTVRCLSPEQHKEQVSKVRSCAAWRRVSREGRDLVQGLLTVEPELRLDLLQCSQHAWLHGAITSTCALLVPESPQDQEVDEEGGVVDIIVGRTGEGVHSIELQLRDGRTLYYGAEGGAVMTTFQLEPKELLVAVMQDFSLDNVLGSSVVFYTSHGRILSINGSEARTRRRFVAPAGRQIAGLQFDGHQLVGTYLEKVLNDGEGAIEGISGRVGSAVDMCEFKLRDGTVYTYGQTGGDILRGPWMLQADEWLVAVEQFFRDRKLGASLAFYTSAGQVFKLSGMTAVKSPRFAAPFGQQICDLIFDETGRLVKVVTCPLSSRPELTKARACTIQL
ncbi:unnamed protein product [Effrenium voratum]|nr:unnamed protein product [Effrenium voratum]